MSEQQNPQHGAKPTASAVPEETKKDVKKDVKTEKVDIKQLSEVVKVSLFICIWNLQRLLVTGAILLRRVIQ